MSLEWLKLHPSDAIHQSFCQFFKKRSERFLRFLISIATQGNQTDADILQGLLQSPLLGYLFLTRP